MDSKKFIKLCIDEVVKYTNEHLDKTDKSKSQKMMYLLCGHAKHFKTTKHC